MFDAFHDRRTGNLATLFWALIGVLLLGMGAFVFKESVEAWLGGRQFAGQVIRRQMSNLVSPDIGAVLSLFLMAGGAITTYAGICHRFPALERRRWFRWMTGFVFGTLMLLILSLGALIVAERLFRL